MSVAISQTSKSRTLELASAALAMSRAAQMRLLTRFGGLVLDSLVSVARGDSVSDSGHAGSVPGLLDLLGAAVDASMREIICERNEEARQSNEMN